MQVLAIIPARGGSKGLKQKNIREVLSKPLIAYSIEAAQKSSLVQRVIVSTDSLEIKTVAEKFGADVPFLRPEDLSGDHVPCNPVLKHALIESEKIFNQKFDIVLYLQPTDIFRKLWMIEKCIQTLIDEPQYDSAFMAYTSHKNFWQVVNHQATRLTPMSELGRQNKPPIYREDTGLACASRRELILQGRRIGDHPKIIPHDSELSSIDIHTEEDLFHAEMALKIPGVSINN